MPMSDFPVLTLLIFSPVVGIAILLALPRERTKALWNTALVFALVPLAMSLVAWGLFAPESAQMQLEDKAEWIPTLGITYHLGIDGLSLPLIVLTTLLTVLGVIYSQGTITERVKEYCVFFLLLEVGMLGVFCALDFFLFYVFWEIGLVPMYFLIGIWGGPKKEYAAIKFFLYTLFGSLAMLLAILALYFHSTPHTFNIPELIAAKPFATDMLRGGLVFWGLFLGFAIKVPLFPFHTWLPLAHTEAPTAGSVILAGVLLKLGTYGFIRICLPMLPQQCTQYAGIVAILALISIIYGALCAMAQKDLKKLVAYSSVNHMGYVMLGVAAAVGLLGEGGPLASAESRTMALNGAVLQMVCHGIITGALFFYVGVVYERAHTRDLSEFGGLLRVTPVYGGLFSMALFASLGLPGLAGFVAEFFVFVGSFATYPLLTCLAAIGIIVTAGYMLWTIQRIFLGPVNERWKDLKDMAGFELAAMAPLAVLMLVIGIYPHWLVRIIDIAMANLLAGIVP